MKKILFIFSYYLPGYKSGGPQQTLQNVSDVYGISNDIYILALNHDMGQEEVYKNIEDGWNRVGNANVLYLSDRDYNAKKICEISKEMDLVFACSLFSKHTIETLILNRLGKLDCKVVIAPMGVFSAGALRQKALKKKLFLIVAKTIGLFRNITWSFSSQLEMEDARRSIGFIEDYFIAEDLPRMATEGVRKNTKKEKELSVIFLSRICPQKNLEQCITVLDHQWNGRISFDIYGTKEDLQYWNRCKAKLEKINSSVQCRYCGEIEPKHVLSTFAKYNVFLFPTRGENFGHVVFEALSVGCVPVISDKTIWNDLDQEHCGFVLPLTDCDGFRNAIKRCLDMSNDEFSSVSDNAVRYARKRYKEILDNSGFKHIFDWK